MDRIICPFEIKLSHQEDDDGTIHGYGSVFGNVDSYGEPRRFRERSLGARRSWPNHHDPDTSASRQNSNPATDARSNGAAILDASTLSNEGLFLRRSGWDRSFDEPIPLPKGKPLVTLRDAALYITKLPKAEHDTAEWQAAMEALLLVAEHGGLTMLARIGVMRALNWHVERVFKPVPKSLRRRAMKR